MFFFFFVYVYGEVCIGFHQFIPLIPFVFVVAESPTNELNHSP